MYDSSTAADSQLGHRIYVKGNPNRIKERQIKIIKMVGEQIRGKMGNFLAMKGRGYMKGLLCNEEEEDHQKDN